MVCDKGPDLDEESRRTATRSGCRVEAGDLGNPVKFVWWYHENEKRAEGEREMPAEIQRKGKAERPLVKERNSGKVSATRDGTANLKRDWGEGVGLFATSAYN